MIINGEILFLITLIDYSLNFISNFDLCLLLQQTQIVKIAFLYTGKQVYAH